MWIGSTLVIENLWGPQVGEKRVRHYFPSSQVHYYRSYQLCQQSSIWHYLGSLKLKPQLSPALSPHYISSGQCELQTHFLALWPSGSPRLWLGRVTTRNKKEIQGDGCDGGRLRIKCKGVKKQMVLFIWKCFILHPLCSLVTHRLTTSCILWVFLTLGHCLTLKLYMELQWQKLKWDILESFMQNASSYYDNILPTPITCTHKTPYILCHGMDQEFCPNAIRLLAWWKEKTLCL